MKRFDFVVFFLKKQGNIAQHCYDWLDINIDLLIFTPYDSDKLLLILKVFKRLTVSLFGIVVCSICLSLEPEEDLA